MRINVERCTSDEYSTLSTVLVDHKFVCFGLEDEFREDKVSAETRIPSGTYQVGVRTVGGFNKRYAKKFPDFHKGMLQILDVPEFEHILIHIGNTERDTAGCLLVGKGADSTKGKMRITQSTSAYELLYKTVIDSALEGELSIQIEDYD